MSALDWGIVLLLNGSIIAYGLYLSRGVVASTDWFLAGRRLPWWLVGLSMYATAIDSSDLVADSGGAYTLGIGVMIMNWVGVVGGWGLGAFFIMLPMYRAGMYTNAEYLEARFGVSARVICAFVQVQYRTLVLGLIATAAFLTLSIVSGWSDSAAWGLVGGIAVLAAIYTAFGGLRSVAVTDTLQFGVMTLAGLIIWFMVWGQVGGWGGIEENLEAHEPGLAVQMMTMGNDRVEVEDVSAHSREQIERKLLTGGEYNPERGTITYRTPAWLVAVAFVIIGIAYAIVNHTQSMRMFAARSEWDMKMSVSVAGAVLLVMTFFNLSMGVMGRALFPDQSVLPGGSQDAIYPYLVGQFDIVGLKGLVVAGILAAALSTYDSIGSTLSALLTRDVYARLLVRDRDDRHYLRVGQYLTPVIIASSFLYVPFLLEGGMLLFYIDLTSALVIPLLTLFLMGAMTRVHRKSGVIGLVVGTLYGVLRLLAPLIAEHFGVAVLPRALVNTYMAYPFSMLLTGSVMVLVSAFAGWEPRGISLVRNHEQSPWLRTSQLAVRELQEEEDSSARALPAYLAVALFAVGCLLSFVVLW